MNYLDTLLADAENLTSAAGQCTSNGKPIPCSEFFNHVSLFTSYGVGILILLIISGILTSILGASVFIRIYRDPLRDPLRDKELWLVMTLLFGIIGTIVYYSL